MTVVPFSEDQSDALQEIANVAMGQAGASLATLLDAFVVLSVPRSRILESEGVSEAVVAMVGADENVTAVRQAFYDSLRGEAIIIFGAEGCNDLADLMGHDNGDMDDESEQELLLDVSNILVGAVLNSIGVQLEAEFNFGAPQLMAFDIPLDKLLNPEHLGWSHALLIEVNFTLEERGFSCHLVMLMPEESIDLMRGALDKMLEEL